MSERQDKAATTEVPTTISAWVYDPTNALFSDKNGRAARYKIACRNPQGCDLFTKSNTCLLTSGMSSCSFGQKTRVDGPTKRSRNFHSWMTEQRRENAEFINKLSTNQAYNRIVKINGYYYLPYAHMGGMVFGDGSPMSSQWVAEPAMTAELLDRICKAKPRALMGGVIESYQNKEVPKFLSDLRMFFPDLFALLSDDNQKRAASVSNIGRVADITTCLPGSYVFADKRWTWDGATLIGTSMLFQPVKGSIVIAITPERGQPVKITDDAQVGPDTVFLD